MVDAYVSLGSNIEPQKNIRSCMQQLLKDFPDTTFSKIYETSAEGFEGEPFLNLVAKFTTVMAPEALRTYLRNLEDSHGRVRGNKKFSSRTLDADLLLYGQLNQQNNHNLPHTDILKYAFVLYPLAEIAADTLHPTYSLTIGELAAQSSLPREAMVEVRLT